MSLHLPIIQTKKTTNNNKTMHYSKSTNFRASMPLSTKANPVNRNIEKYCRTSDVRDILGPQRSINSEPEGGKQYNLEGEISGNLKLLRKQYDNFKNQQNQKEKEIQKMRHEIDIIKMKLNGFQGSNTDEKTLEQQLMDQQNQIEQQIIDAKQNKQSYEMMKERLKNDILTYQLRVYNIQQEYDKQALQLNQAKEKYQKQKQRFHKIEQGYNQVKQQKEAENESRERNIEKFYKEAQEKQEVERQKEERIIRQIEIAEMAANDIRDGNLKKWRKLWLVHKFLSSFLKQKMEREMNQYCKVEKAFQQIKAATGIQEAGQIVHKFLNREHTYSHLLISIADYEKQIDELKKENEKAKIQLENLKGEYSSTDKDLNKNTNYQLEEVMRKHGQVSEKFGQCSITEQRVSDWLRRNVLRMSRAVNITNPNQNDNNDESQNENQNLGDMQISEITIQEHPKFLQVIKGILEEFLVNKDPTEVKENIAEYIKNKRIQDQNSISNNQVLNFQEPGQNNNSQINLHDRQSEENQLYQEEFKKRNMRVFGKTPQNEGNTTGREGQDTQEILVENNYKGNDDEEDFKNFEKEENSHINILRNNMKHHEQNNTNGSNFRDHNNNNQNQNIRRNVSRK